MGKKTLKKPTILFFFILISLGFRFALNFNSPISQGHVPWNSARIAQGSSPSISCDVENGESFQQDNISSINWTVTGYQSCLYVLKDNGVENFFGTVLENNSFRIQHEFTNLEGWHGFSIHIHSGGIKIAELYVVIQIIAPANPWVINLPWILASVAIVTSTTLNIYFSRNKHHKRGRGESETGFDAHQGHNAKQDQERVGSIDTYPARSDVIVSSNAEEIAEWDFISSTRIEKIWIFTPNTQPQLQSQLYRRDRISPLRETTFDKNVLSVIQKNLHLRIPEDPVFANISGLEDSERLLIFLIQNKIFVAVLLSGRISSNYLTAIVSTFRNLPSWIFNKMDNFFPDFQKVMEESLHLTRSYSFIQSGPASDILLKESGLFTLIEDQSVWDEVQDLNLSECNEIIQNIRTKINAKNQDSYYDEAEVLHEDD